MDPQQPSSSTEEEQTKQEQQEMKEIEAKLSQQQQAQKEYQSICVLDHSFGFESLKRNNICFVKENILVTTVGNTIQFFDIRDKRYRWITMPGTGGLGALAVHPSKKYIAVGEKSREKPVVRIYECKIESDDIDGISLEPFKILRNGTLKAFSSMSFNTKGDRLATVGSDPDYLLTIWNWQQEKIALRYKAFGQEVFSVSFSSSNDGQLTTSGTGHIKFWKMAKTFTGLKLKGQIGKFGKVDISDIASCVELPDGKVLSGSESGFLLLWDENLIKCLFTRANEEPCHVGGIEVVFFDEKSNQFVTGGGDGFIRFWNFDKIDSAEPVDTNNIICLTPTRELKISDGVSIITIVREGNIWVVQDSKGAFWKVQIDDNERTKVLSFHAGAITGLATSPCDHVAVTGGEDGTVRLFDYFWAKKEVYSSRFSSGVSKLIWNPPHVDLDGLTITVGFNDGSLRLLKRCEDCFCLMKVVKPHKKRINDFCYSNGSNWLATCSEDCTIFFLNSTTYEPIGYAKFEKPAKSLIPTSNSNELLVLFKDGTMSRLQSPDPSMIDTSKTYEFKPVTKQVNFSQFLKKVEPPKKVKKEGDDDEEEEEEQEKKEEVKEELPAGIYFGTTSPEGSLLISLEKPQGVVKYDRPILTEFSPEVVYPKKFIGTYESICSSIRYSSCGNYLILGFKDGFVCLIDLKAGTEHRFEYVHDCMHGEITSAVTSFDDSYLLTVGREGCFFSQKIPKHESQQGQKPQLTFKSEENEVEDLTPGQSVSIEEAREQAEINKKQEEAKKRKMKKQQMLQQIKAKYLELLKENDRREPDLRLSREEIQVDVTLKDRVLESNKRLLEETRKEMEWLSAKHDIALKKLRDHFIDCLDVERIVLRAFKSGKIVTSFKTRKLDEDLKKEIEKVHQLINEEIHRKRALRNQIQDAPPHFETHDAENTPPSATNKKKKLNGNMSNFEKQEILKRENEERSRLRKLLLEKKPLDTDEDPEEIAEILRAQQNMGDYKLKTNNDYIVPDAQRVTTEKKLRQITLLQESMHTLRMVFNVRLLGLRDLKMRLIDKFRGYNEKIQEINNKIGITEKLYEPELNDEEYPERRENITMTEIEGDDQEKVEEKANSVFSGASKKSSAKTHLNKHKEKDENGIPISRLSELEIAEKEAEYQRLLYEKNRYLRKQEKQIESFDTAIEDLRREKFKLEGDLKSADLKLLLLYRELKILRDYETKDLQKIQELLAKKQEKAAIQAQISECQEQLRQKKKEVQQIKKQKYLIQEFNSLVPQNHAAYSELWKLFTGNDHEDDEENLSDVDSTNGDKKDKIPQGCSEELYHQVFDLKVRRIEQEKALNAIDKAAKSIKTKREGFQKIEANIIKDLNKIEDTIRETQKEKQHKINDLETIVVLKFNQIQSLVQNKIPADLSDQIVFTNKSLQGLFARIRELSEERKILRRKYMELQKTQRTMLKEQKILEEKFQSEKDKVREVQMLKFGREINLEEMENAKIDLEAEELKSELNMREQEASRILKEWDNKITEYKQTMIKITSENTQLLTRISELKAKQQELEHYLNLAQNTVIERMERTITTTKDNTSQYKQIINEQNAKIESVKNDIAMLTFKASSLGY
ncbi:hypothetical protein FDP41_013171 [Naegleria fowleri]|uniref:EML-like first beta-propeller domain-containing protein n=1 Tax=Naegleria fowleri TaxID=5763 RepID=A0A6A5C496_NAEFO|nr:uncharacterized protein FDP41_013171 [Naegleria fowleri]KAF0980688.1 hypothetical protein FDP41_013171 [Naegleria fowleri]